MRSLGVAPAAPSAPAAPPATTFFHSGSAAWPLTPLPPPLLPLLLCSRFLMGSYAPYLNERCATVETTCMTALCTAASSVGQVGWRPPP